MNLDERIQFYFSEQMDRGDIGRLLSAKDYFLAQLYYLGEQESMLQLKHDADDIAHDTQRGETFISYRKEGDAEKTAYFKSALATAALKMEGAKSGMELKGVRNKKDTLNKIIDSISQRISILRREEEFNQHIK
jgi:hypothetical protein